VAAVSSPTGFWGQFGLHNERFGFGGPTLQGVTGAFRKTPRCSGDIIPSLRSLHVSVRMP
jgi:hypothetical protein